jgi:hypothetical protein
MNTLVGGEVDKTDILFSSVWASRDILQFDSSPGMPAHDVDFVGTCPRPQVDRLHADQHAPYHIKQDGIYKFKWLVDMWSLHLLVPRQVILVTQ